MNYSWILPPLLLALGSGCSRRSQAAAGVETDASLATISSSATPSSFGALDRYTFRTFDGYDITSADNSGSTVIFVWSTSCKSCGALRGAMIDLYLRRYSTITFIAVSRDDEGAWRAHLGGGSALVEVRDATGSFGRDTKARDGTIFVIAPDHTVRWRGEWDATTEAELDVRLAALPTASP